MAKKRERRRFDAAFKREAVRRMEERRAVQVPLATIARDLDVRPEQLRMWADQLAAESGRPLTEIFPGEGRLSSEAEEIRRLQREVETLRMERDFLKKASVDSTGHRNIMPAPAPRVFLWPRLVVPAFRLISANRSGRCGRRASQSPSSPRR
jgi:transposase